MTRLKLSEVSAKYKEIHGDSIQWFRSLRAFTLCLSQWVKPGIVQYVQMQNAPLQRANLVFNFPEVGYRAYVMPACILDDILLRAECTTTSAAAPTLPDTPLLMLNVMVDVPEDIQERLLTVLNQCEDELKQRGSA